jgi:Fe-S-cluster containining protein
MSLKPFPCNQCGKCCLNVHLSALTQMLDRGDGVCRHLNEDMHCSIYEKRPEICQIKLQYQLNYSKQYSWDEFITVNLEVCESLGKKNV